ncbi:tRNA-dihydrouridine(16/17) synthase [NAD(P)(+)]-like (Liver regeneration-related protein LRRG08/LRRG09) (tRNA-dihydrouridine synthase 1-like) [Durusdinium trenchii]|uniref:tRNA-dihydrouridine synthase n=1 Tax=Durusdinium trenchii TaxID=1381693 RepID=A0ABP0MSI7_9DINO
MLMADEFGTDAMYRRKALGDRIDEEDHPLVVQFAANRAEDLLSAALAAQAMGADGIDINLGCPQRRAREGNYGAWLANEEKNWPLIGEMLKECVQCPALKIPVVCKIRLQHTLSATIKFAQLLEASGCALLTIHGRKLSGAPKHRDGPADLGAIAAVRQSLGIPVVSNGNVRRPEEVWRNLQCTGCEGIMCAEQLLHDPALFERGRTGPTTPRTSDPLKALTSPSAEELVDEYLGYCGSLTQLERIRSSALLLVAEGLESIFSLREALHRGSWMFLVLSSSPFF